MQFSYRGRNSRGEMVSGLLDAANANAAAIQLQNKAIVPVSIQEHVEKGSGQFQISFKFRKKVGYDDLIMFCRQMRALTRAGIPIIQATAGLADISKSEPLKEALSDVNTRLATGSSLSQ